MRTRLFRWPVTAAVTLLVLAGTAPRAGAEETLTTPTEPVAAADVFTPPSEPESDSTEQSIAESSFSAALAAPLVAAQAGACPVSPLNQIIGVEYEVNGVVVPRLRGYVTSGQVVTVRFLVDPNCTDPVTVSLVSYFAPKATFDPTKADQQKVADTTTGTFAPSTPGQAKYSLTVTVPNCYFQVDFVQGDVITTLGPKGSNNFYSAQGRLVDSAEGGVTACLEVKAEDPKVNGEVKSATAEVKGVTLAETGGANGALAIIGLGLTALGFELRRRLRFVLGELSE